MLSREAGPATTPGHEPRPRRWPPDYPLRIRLDQSSLTLQDIHSGIFDLSELTEHIGPVETVRHGQKGVHDIYELRVLRPLLRDQKAGHAHAIGMERRSTPPRLARVRWPGWPRS